MLSINAFAQKGIIQGYINDADSKSAISGASILLPGNKADYTDNFGMFTIPGIEPGQYEMTVSHIGYRTELLMVDVKAGARATLRIGLHRAGLDLSGITVNSKRNSALHTIGEVDIRLRPVNTSQDVLRIVPGLFIAQHAGGGKAEQIFLRGFDIDHGTDINITVDGLPVNMVSHAHGQGYADLHFLIPETIEKVSFDKGPYFVNKGDFATAAFVGFTTKDIPVTNSIKLEAGDFNSFRTVGQIRLLDKLKENSRHQLYIASEYSSSDGYFESLQDFHRFNIMGKYNAWLNDRSQLTFIASTFDSKWNASGQIPDRAVRSGTIGRFGSIDDTEGGNTGRTNLSLKFITRRKNNWQGMDQVYFTNYHFNLFSNFTFYLLDPVNGDMINQRETRNIFGYSTTESKSYFINGNRAQTEFGAGIRYDNVKDISLSRAVKRSFLEFIRNGDVKQLNNYLFVNQGIEIGKKWNINAGLRYDHFTFKYKDKLLGETGFRQQSKSIVSPKFNISLNAGKEIKLYLNNGIGFHSNDARVILDKTASDILPRVFGTDLGIIFKPRKNLVLKTALWHLYSEQEFVYVGDAGIVEPSGATRRLGIDVSARMQFNKWLYGDIDLNLTRARAIGEAKGEDFVPLAPSFTSMGGLTAKMQKGFSGSLRYRMISQRPANEDYSVIAQGYFLLDMVLAYRLKKFELHLSAENILDREWREAQFNTKSRLSAEPSSVTEIHYTPGAPRFIKAGVTFNF